MSGRIHAAEAEVEPFKVKKLIEAALLAKEQEEINRVVAVSSLAFSCSSGVAPVRSGNCTERAREYG